MSCILMLCPECGGSQVLTDDKSVEDGCDTQGCSGVPTALPFPHIAVALSGGGHRASLFGLGVLLALVDLGLNRLVTQIVSVSGGSITNAYVGLRGNFRTATSTSFDALARDFASTIVSRGLVNRKEVFLCCLLATATAILLHGALSTIPWGRAVFGTVGILVVSIVMVCRGKLLERRLAQRLRVGTRTEPQLKNLGGDGIEHVLCCTELTTGRPAYFRSTSGGQLVLRLADSSLGRRYSTRSCPDFPVASAVRASAAFPPFISALRVSSTDLAGVDGGSDTQLTGSLQLADGGVWNNLGTQSFLEDELPRAPGAVRPDLIFVANASAAFQPGWSWPFRFPGAAELQLALQASSIQGLNTVEPRNAELRRSMLFRLKYRTLPWIPRFEPFYDHEPVAVPIEISSSAFETALRAIVNDVGSEAPERSAAYREWSSSLIEDLEAWQLHRRTSSPDAGDQKFASLQDLVDQKFPFRKTERDPLDLTGARAVADEYLALDLNLDVGALDVVRTTLGRIPAAVAKQLITRSYINTCVMARLLGLDTSEHSPLTNSRLDWLVGISGDPNT
jgi:predicted acylesterase/phospholipase RssA